MSKKNPSSNKVTAKPSAVQKRSKASVDAPSTGFDRWEKRFSTHRKKIFYSFCFLTGLFSLLLFNIRISEGGDDSTYIYGGYKYSQDFFHYFFAYNAPLWPMFLGIMIKFFGVNLVVLKFTSAIFYFFSFLLFYKTFEKRVPYFIFIPAAFFYAINSHLQYFASQTYNEAFFLFFQSLFVYVFVKLLDRLKTQDGLQQLKQNWIQWINVGLLMTALSLTKNLGVVVFPIVILFFLTQKQWKNALIVSFTSIGARISYEVIKRLIWGSLSQFATQGALFLRKNPYIENSGSEDLSGFAIRFINNCGIYLCNRLFQVFGFIGETNEFMSVIVTLLVAGILLYGLYRVWKEKETILFFVCFYLLGSLTVSFVILHVLWAQERLFVIFVPMILIVMYYAVHKLIAKYSFGFFMYSVLVLIISGSVVIDTVGRSSSNISILKKNLKGDLYYGYTTDWVHFLKMSRWCADSLPHDAVVVSRKAAMSFIYGHGKEFFPINHNMFYDTLKKECDADSLLMFCKQNKIKYFILASLRYFHDRKSDRTINTIELLLTPLHRKSPEKLVFVHAEGDKDDEPTYLYELKY